MNDTTPIILVVDGDDLRARIKMWKIFGASDQLNYWG